MTGKPTEQREPLPDGLHFGLDETTYHADDALSTSGMKDIIVDPLTYWREHLDPERDEAKDSNALAYGSAFHCRILEPERFAEQFVVAPDKADYPDAIDGGADLRAKCAELDLPKSGTIAEMCARIVEADPAVQLWPLIVAEFEAANEGKTILNPDDGARLESAARIIGAHPAVSKAVGGGFAEVSIVWTDQRTGIRQRARFDYLKTKAVIDVKTFANKSRLPIDQAIARAVANENYHVQAVNYKEAAIAAKVMLAEKGSDAVFVHSGPAPSAEWLEAFRDAPPPAFVFLFVEKHKRPNVRMREFTSKGSENVWNAAAARVRYARETFAHCLAKYGTDKPWIEDDKMRAFVDEEFPLWAQD